MKILERVIEKKLGDQMKILKQQYGFMPRKSTAVALFALKMLLEKCRERKKELHHVILGLKMAFDIVPKKD